MPTSASSATRKHSPDLLARLSSSDGEIKLKALRDVKNQIIGNRTKKLSFIKLGAVSTVAAVLSTACDSDSHALIQSAATLGSFACGVDTGVRAVLDAGTIPHLLRLLSNPDEKVVDAGARALKMIYQSKLAPKYDFLHHKNVEFILSLLHSENENVTGLGASIINHSCESFAEQKSLCSAGVLEKLISLLDGSLSQRDASLESLATIFNNNFEAISKFTGPARDEERLSCIVELTKERCPRTRLLACICVIVIRNCSPYFLQDVRITMKLIHNLLELLDDPSQVGDEASFAFSSLIKEKEDVQKLAFQANAIDKIYIHLQKNVLNPKRYQGLLLALADLCSKLECGRSSFLSLQALNLVTDALNHSSDDVRVAACICLRSLSRSIKNLSAGYFMNEVVIIPLVHLLQDTSNSVQVAALGAISNIVVDLTTRRTVFIKCGGVKELVHLSKSMDSIIRFNALWALRNLMFHADNICKEIIFLELTASLLASLVCDPESFVQEQAMSLVCNLIDGCMQSVEYVFASDGVILDAIGRQLQGTSKAEIGIQGMYVLCNVASGNEVHKEAVMKQLFQRRSEVSQSFVINFLQSNDDRLRTAAIWTIVNLTVPSSPFAQSRVAKFQNAGILSQIKNMADDICVDVKLRVRTALGQFMAFGDFT